MFAHPLPDWLKSVHHDGSQKYVDGLYPRSGETIRLRLRVGKAAPVKRVYLRTFPDGEQRLTLMKRGTVGDRTQWWEGELPVTEPLVHYRFLLEAADGIWSYTAAGPVAHTPLDGTDFRILADYDPPSWLQGAVFYQIFPDRFANGNPSTNPHPGAFEYRGHKPQTYPWGSAPPADQLFPLVFYGGDIPGIVQRLDYIASLGVNALYLNPIFTAFSNHKYDVTDYEQVDPHLGGNHALVDLRRALDRRRMRYLLDVVPNHCGYSHPWFQKARRDRNATEASFFTFLDHPDEYANWLGVWSLPKLNYESRELRRRIYKGPNAVFRRWLRPPYAADGWRVDVANMLGRQGSSQLGVDIARGIRHSVKETRRDAYLLGENFFDATLQLQGDQWDGVMNYGGFTMPLWHWLRGFRQQSFGLDRPIEFLPWSTATMAVSWQTRLAAVPWSIALQQFNLLDSHDTPRIRTIVGERDGLQQLALATLLTFPGVPCLYYGDEVGMTDSAALASRECMVWDEAQWDQALLTFYRRAIALRRSSPVLQRGGFQLLAAEPDTFAYQREGAEGRVLVVGHRGEHPRPAGPLDVAHGDIADGTRFVEYFSGRETVVSDGSLLLPAQGEGATVWLTELA